MLTTKELMVLQKFNPAYREEKLTAALRKAQAFALKHIAPMTDPNTGTSTSEHATRGTPKHYAIERTRNAASNSASSSSAAATRTKASKS